MRRKAVTIGLCVAMASLCCGGCGGTDARLDGIGTTMSGTSIVREAASNGLKDEKLMLTVSIPADSHQGNEHDVEPYSQSYEVKQDEHYVVPEEAPELSFTITEVSDDGIRIETDEAMWQMDDDWDVTNAVGDQHQFEIALHDSCRLKVPTMDGRKYEFSLKREEKTHRGPIAVEDEVATDAENPE